MTKIRNWKHRRLMQRLKDQTIAQQEAKMETYVALKFKGFPIPSDLKAECEPLSS